MTFYDEPEGDEGGPAFAENPTANAESRGLRVRFWIVAVLVVLTVILFSAERFIMLVLPNLEWIGARQEGVAVRTLEQEVLGVLDGYGIRENWVSKKQVSLPAAANVRSLWIIRVPSDVPLASINYDLTQLAAQHEARAFAVEDAKTRQVFVHVRFRQAIRYSLVFAPDAGIRRASGSIAMLVDGIEDAGDDAIEQYLTSREPVACILVPDRKSEDVYEQLRTAGKEIVLHIHVFPEGTDAGRYGISEDMKPESVSGRVRLIARSFPKVSAYYVSSESASGLQTQHIDAAFRVTGIRKLETAGLSYIDRTSQFSTMSSRMNDLTVIAARQRAAAGVLELNDGVVEFLRNDMMRLRKRGYDFISVRRYLDGNAPAAQRS